MHKLIMIMALTLSSTVFAADNTIFEIQVNSVSGKTYNLELGLYLQESDTQGMKKTKAKLIEVVTKQAAEMTVSEMLDNRDKIITRVQKELKKINMDVDGVFILRKVYSSKGGKLVDVL